MQLVAPRVLKDVRPDVAHFTNGMIPPFPSVPTVVTVHDMSLRLYPDCHPLRRLIINRPLLSVAIRAATSIVTVSNSARSDLRQQHGVSEGRVSVVYEAAHARFRPIADCTRLDEVRRRYGLPQRFVLYVGTIEPRKNLPRLVKAFAAARARGIPHELVCAGPYGWSSRDLTDVIDRAGVRPQVHFTGYVPVDDLPAIYNLAEIFAFPSMYEGFGLPVVEAMACGTPVVTSNTSSLAEIASGSAETVDPYNVDALAASFVRLANDAARRRELSERGIARARQFSWTRTAREMLAVYQRAAGLSAPHYAPPVSEPVPTETGSLAMSREASS
jgi:glycosyltransferase involved in cell wall biosynthesis